MREYTRTAAGTTLAVLLLVSVWAAAQSAKPADGGKKGGNPPAASPANSSAASGQKGKSGGGMQGAQSNPLYKDNNNQGNNPLFEGRDSIDKGKGASGSGAHAGPEAATRTRPGNHKAMTDAPPGKTGASVPAEYKDGEDGTTHTRPDKPK